MAGRFAFLLGIAGVAAFAVVCGSLAQAPPGPLPPGDGTTAASPAANMPPEKELERTRNLGGFWSLNLSESDDPRKIREQGRGGHGSGGRFPGGGGYPGGNGGWGRQGGMHRGGNDDERQKMQEFLRPATTVSFTQKEPEIDLTDDQGRTRTYFLDGRKLQKPKDASREELAAKWDEYRLVTQEKSPHGDKVERDFEVAPGGQQLYETLHFTIGRNKTPASIRYVYDRGLGPKPAAAH